ncbi:hypothetical protein [Terrimonas pollutisoli]|uniref:hypothetical protein n=1 Tax=Terrimonas pollutisoli TaxID=3034147 RepID=UPI0023EC08D0|nr:hypothetical protein [Terrimonas sp. H1YJ31]
MKAQFSIIGFTAILFTAAWTAPVPTEGSTKATVVTAEKPTANGISNVRSHRQGKGVTTSWSVDASEGVVTFLLQKTYEDPNDEYAVWEDVTSTPCNGSRSYKATDNGVYPGNITYRVVGLKGDGTSITSAYTGVRIVSH